MIDQNRPDSVRPDDFLNEYLTGTIHPKTMRIASHEGCEVGYFKGMITIFQFDDDRGPNLVVIHPDMVDDVVEALEKMQRCDSEERQTPQF